MAGILYLVIPCYNEEEALPITAPILQEKMHRLMDSGVIAENSKIIFVNDGSMDLTWKLICRYHEEDPIFGGINLSRNRGHQNALLAGLMTVKDDADVVISLDADLQDDVDAIDKMIAKYDEGYDVVYGVRNDRKTDSFMKRWSAQSYYRFARRMGGELIYNHADYRLMSRRAIEGLSQFSEVNLFLRGIIPLVGYPSTTVQYSRNKRNAGKSKYTLGKMMALAIDGITSFSVKPMRFVMVTGFITFLISIGMLIYTLIRFFTGHTITGWSSMNVSIWFIGGIVLLSLGIVGEYIGKIYLETKNRPKYIVEEYLK